MCNWFLHRFFKPALKSVSGVRSWSKNFELIGSPERDLLTHAAPQKPRTLSPPLCAQLKVTGVAMVCTDISRLFLASAQNARLLTARAHYHFRTALEKRGGSTVEIYCMYSTVFSELVVSIINKVYVENTSETQFYLANSL